MYGEVSLKDQFRMKFDLNELQWNELGPQSLLVPKPAEYQISFGFVRV